MCIRGNKMSIKDIKRTAREALRGNWMKAFVTSMIFSLISGTGGFGITITTVESPETENGVTALISSAAESPAAGLGGLLLIASLFSIAFSIIMLVVRYALFVGYSQFNLDIIDGNDVRIGTLFSRFDRAKTAIFAGILVAIRVLFGLLLFIVPGIMAIYGCSMVYFIIADNPDMTAREAIRESRRMMKGNRWKLFCLELSFIPGVILSVLTLGIGFIWLIPHMQASYAAFYREVE